MDGTTTLIIALVIVAAALWFWYRTGGGSGGAESELRRICLGNEAQAERLIEGEMKRAPGISRIEATRRAIERYRRDNR